MTILTLGGTFLAICEYLDHRIYQFLLCTFLKLAKLFNLPSGNQKHKTANLNLIANKMMLNFPLKAIQMAAA